MLNIQYLHICVNILVKHCLLYTVCARREMLVGNLEYLTIKVHTNGQHEYYLTIKHFIYTTPGLCTIIYLILLTLLAKLRL